MIGNRRKRIEWERQGACIVVTSHAPDGNVYITMTRTGDGRKPFKLHRLICERRHGSLGDMVARHTCDRPNCINPEHLIPGTPADNSGDMIARNRTKHIGMKGSKNMKSKLTEAQVSEIRKMPGSHLEIARIFNVSKVTIRHIRTGRRWPHVK